MKRLLALMFVLVSVVYSPPSNTAKAGTNVYFTSPWATYVPVQAYFGKVGTSHWVIYKNVNTGACATWYVGGSIESDFIIMTLSTAGDSVEVPGVANGAVVWCDQGFGLQPWYFNPPVFASGVGGYAGGGVSIDGGAGNDYMSCNGPAISCDGNDGNDTILSSSENGHFEGGTGDDIIIVSVLSSNSWLSGGVGNDCISAPTDWRPARYDCGPTWGDKSTGYLGANCECLVTSCYSGQACP